MNRYNRQMILPGFGAEGQARLTQALVTVVGAGGLGCPVLQYLAGAGVGRIRVIDPDHVEESNLHRQPLYRMADLGRPKAHAARDHLSAANPVPEIEAKVMALDPANAARAIAGSDVVVDAADSFAVSYTLSDLCLETETPLVSASVLGQSGYAGGFCGTAPSLRAVFPDPPASAASCALAGVMGPVVGMIGSAQAQMVLQILLGHQPSPLGQLLTVDMAGPHLTSFSFAGTAEPETAFPFVARSQITASDQVIDLRSVKEAPVSVHEDVQRVSPADLSRITSEPGRRVVLCCTSGLRAWRAATALAERGFAGIALCADAGAE